MATFNFFNSFATEAAAGSHANILNADTGTVRAYLTNATPSASADSVKADLAEIATGNGYTGPVDTQNAATQTGTQITVVGTDFSVTATGAVGPFAHVAIYNDDTTGDMLIGWWTLDDPVTLSDTQVFTVDFSTEMFTFGP